MRYAMVVVLITLACVFFGCMDESGNEPQTKSVASQNIVK